MYVCVCVCVHYITKYNSTNVMLGCNNFLITWTHLNLSLFTKHIKCCLVEWLNSFWACVRWVHRESWPRADTGTKGRGGCGVVAEGPEGPPNTTPGLRARPGSPHGAPAPHSASALGPACPDKMGMIGWVWVSRRPFWGLTEWMAFQVWGFEKGSFLEGGHAVCCGMLCCVVL